MAEDEDGDAVDLFATDVEVEEGATDEDEALADAVDETEEVLVAFAVADAEVEAEDEAFFDFAFRSGGASSSSSDVDAVVVLADAEAEAEAETEAETEAVSVFCLVIVLYCVTVPCLSSLEWAASDVALSRSPVAASCCWLLAETAEVAFDLAAEADLLALMMLATGKVG